METKKKLISRTNNNAKAWKHQEGGSLYSAGNVVDAIYANNPKSIYLGMPKHKYDFTLSEEWANAHGYFPDERGHRDDRVKKESHPTHPSRGSWKGMNQFHLTDKGMENVNHTLFGMVDGGQDPQATLYYKDSIVLPEITVTPKEKYIHNTYDNIKMKFQKGGAIKRLDINGLRNDPEYKKNYNWYMNDRNLEILQDSMINRNMGYAQRVALLSLVIPESGGNTKPHGNGAVGLIGWRGSRAINLPNNLPGLIHQLMSEIYDNPNAKDWSHGGLGTGVLTGKEMMELFKTTPNSKQAAKSAMKGLVRPEKSEWDKRLQFLQTIKRHMK